MEAVRVFALAVGAIADPSRHRDTGDGHDGACAVSLIFLCSEISSSLTGQGEDEAHAIYNSSRHGECVKSLAGGEEIRPESLVESRRWRKGRSCGVYDTAGCAIRCEACSVQMRRTEALTLGGGSSTKGGLQARPSE